MERQKVKWFLVLVVGVMIFGCAVWSWAQQPSPTSDARQWLQELDQKLEFLRELYKAFPDPQLLSVIRKIEYYRALGLEAAQAGNKREAILQLQIAHKLADIAIKLALDGPVQRLRENLDELIRQVEEGLHRYFSVEADRLLRQAKDNRKTAIWAYKNRNYRKTIELFQVATFLAERAHAILKKRLTAFASALDEEQANFKDLLQRAQELVEGKRDPVAKDLLRQAVVQQQKAERALAYDDPQAAINHYRWATRLLIRIISMAERAELGMREIAVNELQLTRELLQAVERDLSAPLQRIYKKAQQVYRDAEVAFQNQEYSQAMKKAQVARRLLHRTAQMAEGPQRSFDKRLQNEITAVRHLLESLHHQATTTSDKEISLYFRIAKKHLQLSQKAFDKSDYRVAATQLLVSTQMAYSLQSVLSRQEEENRSAEFLAEKILEVEQQLEMVNSTLQQSQQLQFGHLSQLAQGMLQTAKTSMANQQWHVAWDSIKIASQLLQKLQSKLHTNSE